MARDAGCVRRVMLLAAGLGNRLRPLTDHTPKPLLILGGEPLLSRIAGRLSAAGIRHLGINVHHLAGQVAASARELDGFDEVLVFPEPEILGTGGALWGARDFLREGDHFLLHNGDVDCDADLASLCDAHLAGGAAATLLLVDWPEVNSVRLGGDGRVRDIAGRLGAVPAPDDRLLTYTGVAVCARRFLDLLPDGPSDLVDALLAAVADDSRGVRGVAPVGLLWNDLGTPGRYLDALLREDCAVDIDVTAAAVNALPLVRNAGWDVAVPRRLALQGSDRGFWRLHSGEASAVLMKSAPDDPDFARYVAIGRFLQTEGLGGPAIYAHDDADAAVLMEDLGDDTLHRLARAGPAYLLDPYRRALDLLVLLQTAGTDALARGPAAAARVFDAEVVGWEHDYFRERFLLGEAGLSPADLAGLDDDLARVGAAVLSQPVVLMHRDFQSQNILLRDGRARLVDFQGARRGPYAYDLMSLLRDAYVDLGDANREALLDYYRRAAAVAGRPAPAAFARDITAAGLQRVMQALGAFGFLAGVKGKSAFRDHVPLGVRHLAALLAAWRGLPGEEPLGRLEMISQRLVGA
ncbi:phosphotransferase [bacterium]|nr:phosphotransferase [bacterium]